jgi:FkbM family methyltransferase
MQNRLVTAFNCLPVWRRQASVENYTIQVPTFDRWLYAKLHAFRLMGGEERNFLSRHVTAGMTALDIGANIGLYSIFLAELVGGEGKVFGFEPDPSLFEAAVANSRENGKDRILTLQNLALGSQSGHGTLHRSSFNSGDNRMSASPTHKDSVAVRIERLDDVLPDVKIDFIKMDVQGWEAEVLRGMNRILTTNAALTIYFEYWPEGLRRAGEQLSSPIDILRQAGFAIFVPGTGESLSDRQIEKLGAEHTGNRFLNLLARRIRI